MNTYSVISTIAQGELALPPAQQTFDLADRALLKSNHPVVEDTIAFPTPPLVRAIETIIHIIGSGGSGCAFTAFPRFGKTRTITYCCTRLPEVFPNIPIFSFPAHDESHQTSNKFFEWLYETTVFDIKSARTPRKIRKMLVNAWFLEAATRRSRKLICFGDEMQRWTANEFTWLIDISNDLEAMGVRMTSILFAQQQLAHNRAVFLRDGRSDIVGRFMSRWFAFGGIESALELQEVFHCYDDVEHGEFPPGSNLSYTRFFMPLAFDAGWRLANCAGLCWEIFLAQANQRLKRASTARVSVGMRWIAEAVQFALTHYGDLDRTKFSIAKDQWIRAIESTGFAETVGVTYKPDTEG
jgi:hypothetical protein